MTITNGETASDGGLSLNGSSPDIVNNSIVGNRVTDNPDGGGIHCYFSRQEITNSILWGNSPDQIFGDNLTVTLSDVQGGWPGEGNMSEDPGFYEPDNGNYHLPPLLALHRRGGSHVFRRLPAGMGEELSDMGAFGGEENCDWEFGGQDITLLMYPTSPVSVPRGGFLEFRVIIENHQENTVEGDLWFTIMYPDSTEFLIPERYLNYANPFSGQIFPGNSIDPDNTLWVPWGAILGTYRIIGRTGLYPNLVIDEDSIGFRVV